MVHTATFGGEHIETDGCLTIDECPQYAIAKNIF